MAEIQPELYQEMNDLGKVLGKALSPFGFALLVFPFGGDPEGRINYISNSNREDMVCAMKEFISKFEGTTPDNLTITKQ